MTIHEKISDGPIIDSLPIAEKSAKKSQITIPLQYIGGQALRVVGKYIFSEKIIQPVSALGYYGSKGVETIGKVLEAGVDIILHQDVVGATADVAEAAVEEQAKVAVETQKKAASYLKYIPGAAVPVEVLSDVGEKNIGFGVGHVKVVKSVFDWASRYILKPVAWLVKKPITYLKNTATYLSKKLDVIRKDPSAIKDYVVDKGDLLVGAAWRAEVVSQRFMSKLSVCKSQKKGSKETDFVRTTAPITLDELKTMAPEERERILFLVHCASKRLGITKEEKKGQVNDFKKFTYDKTDELNKSLESVVKLYNKLTDKELSAITPVEFSVLSKLEKIRLVDAIFRGQLTLSDRQALKEYRVALETGAKIKKHSKTESFVIEKFNALPHKQQARLLNISSKEIASLTGEEKKALTSLIVEKVKHATKLKASTDLLSLETISQKAEKDWTVSDCKHVSRVLKKTFSQMEKATIRQMLRQKVATTTITEKQLQTAIADLEAEIAKKQSKLSSTSGDAEILSTLELIESLHYLKGIDTTDVMEADIKESAAALPQVDNPAILTSDHMKKVGDEVTTGKVISEYVFGATATVAGAVAELPFRAVSEGMRSFGSQYLSPAAVSFTLGTAANLIEHSQLISMIGSYVGPGLYSIGKYVSGGGEDIDTLLKHAQGVFDKFSGATQFIAEKTSQIGQMTISGIIKAEEQAIGLVDALNRYQQSSWKDYVVPVLERLKSISGYKEEASKLQALGSEVDKLTSSLKDSVATAAVDYKIPIEELYKKIVSTGEASSIPASFESFVTVLKDSGLKEGTKEFYEAMLSHMGSDLTLIAKSLVKDIPKECVPAWFGLYQQCGPGAAGLHVEEVTAALSSTEQLRQNAEHAQKTLEQIQKFWGGWFKYLPEKESVEMLEKLKAGAQEPIDRTIELVKGGVYGLGIQLKIMQGQVQFLTETAPTAVSKLTDPSKEDSWGWGWTKTLAKSAVEFAGFGLNYCNGKLALNMMTRVTSRALRRLSPHIAPLIQPAWYGLAEAVGGVGFYLGKGVTGAIGFVGGTAIGFADKVYSRGYEAVFGEKYIDPLRIARFKTLTLEQRRHIAYLVINSPDCLDIRKKLTLFLKREQSEDLLPETKEWFSESEEIEKLIGVDGRSVELLLQGFDKIQHSISTQLSPDLFEALDLSQKENVIRLVTKEIGLTKEELKNPRAIVLKYNQVSEKKRKEVNNIKSQEFYSLDPAAQKDLIYRIINSKVYREKTYPKESGLTDAEISYQISKQYMRVQSKGCDQKELKRLLSMSERVVAEEPLSIITPSQLESMALAEEKIGHMVDILIDRGKFKPFPKTDAEKEALGRDELLKLEALRVFQDKSRDVRVQNLQKKYLPVIVKMFNEELIPAQQGQFLNMRETEFTQFVPEEKIKLLNFLLSQKPTEKNLESLIKQKDLILEEKSEPDVKGIIEIFNGLNSSLKAEWNQSFEISRLEVSLLAESALKEIKYEEKILKNCRSKIDNINSKLEAATAVFKEILMMQKDALLKKIAHCETNIQVYREKIVKSKAGRPLRDILTQEAKEEIAYFTDLKSKLVYQTQAILMKYSSKTDPNVKLSLTDEDISKDITAEDRENVEKLLKFTLSSESKIEEAKKRLPVVTIAVGEDKPEELPKEIVHLLEDEKISKEKLTDELYENMMSSQIASLDLKAATSLAEYSQRELDQLKDKPKADQIQVKVLEKQIQIIEQKHPQIRQTKSIKSELKSAKQPTMSRFKRFGLALARGWKNFTRIFTLSFRKRDKK